MARRREFLRRLTLAQRFSLVSLVIMVTSMVGVGAWVGTRIEEGVIHESAGTSALYVDSFIAPLMQDMGSAEALTPEQMLSLGAFLEGTSLQQQIVAFKLWDRRGRVLYSTTPALIGRSFPPDAHLTAALGGQLAAGISGLDADENELERQQESRLLEIYTPVRRRGTGEVIAAAEFYQRVDALQDEIAAAQRRSWLVVGAAGVAMYLLLVGFVQRASNTIARQEETLRVQIERLTEVLDQNVTLHARVRRAAARSAALHERLLRRTSAELHDGPVQDIALALLRLDTVMACCTAQSPAGAYQQGCAGDLEAIEGALQHAMRELRAISAGMGLPQLEQLTLAEALGRAVRAHERRSGTRVVLHFDGVPDQVPPPLKATLYRLVQEALTNAYRHGGGVNQEVTVRGDGEQVCIAVRDQGPGFARLDSEEEEGHLGVAGMRERVESLGGHFQIDSAPGSGTVVSARIALHTEPLHIEDMMARVGQGDVR